jgi:hypothetical protein
VQLVNEKHLARLKLINLKVRQKVKVSDEDLKAEYARFSRLESAEYELMARHILVQLLPQATEAQIGEISTIKITSTVTLEIVTKDSEGSKKMVITLDAGEDFTQEVLLAAGGIVRKAKVTCDRSFRSKSVEGGTGESWTSTLQGMNLIVTHGDSPRVEVDGGGELPVGGDAVGAWNAYTRLLPKAAQKPGDSWKVDVGAVAPALWADFENAGGDLTVKLDRVEQNHATLTLSGTIKGNTREGFEGTLELASTSLLFDLVKGRPVSFTLGGTLSLLRKIKEVRPKPGSLTEEVEVVHGEIAVKSTRMNVTVKFE